MELQAEMHNITSIHFIIRIAEVYIDYTDHAQILTAMKSFHQNLIYRRYVLRYI